MVPARLRLRHRRLRLWSVALAVALAGAARLAVVDRQSLWADEVFSLAMATGHSLEHAAAEANAGLGDYVEPAGPAPAAAFRRYAEHEEPAAGPGRVLRAVRLSDTSPPLYYLLLHGWTRAAGTGDVALRLFSVLWSLATLPVLATLAARLGGPGAVLPACTLFAVVPVGVLYSTEGRMYSMLWFLASALVLLTLDLGRPERRGLREVGWAVTAAAGLLTHYFFVFVWAACAAWLAARGPAPRRRRLAVAAVVTGLLVAWWYVLVPETLGRWRVTAGWLDGPRTPALAGAPFQLAWGLLTGDPGPHVTARARPGWLPSGTLAAILVGVVARGQVRALTAGRRRLVWLWWLAPCAGVALFDVLLGTRASLVAPRYVLAALPAALLLVALGLARLPGAARAALLALLVLGWVPSLRALARSESRAFEPFRKIGAILESSRGASDVMIVHSIPSGVIGLARHLGGDAALASWVPQLGRRVVPDDLEALEAGRRRTVLVIVHAVGAPAPQEAWLRAHATLLAEVRLEAARLLAFGPAPAPTARPGPGTAR